VTAPVTGATYTWTASAGTANGSSYTFNTSTAGAKTATVNSKVASNGATCQSANATVSKTVNAAVATPGITASTTAAGVCLNGALSDWVTAPVSGATYTWTASAGTANGSSYTFNTSAAGAKTATVNSKVTSNGATCQSANATVSKTVNAAVATPGITASTTAAGVCLNGALSVWVTAPVTGATYTWTASAGTANGSSYTFNTSTAGAKTATVNSKVASNGATCQSANATNVSKTVNPAVATPAITASAATVYQNAALSVWVTTPVSGATYTWAASAGTASGSSYTFNTSTAGAKTATVNAKTTVNGATCQSANAGATATVNAGVAYPPCAVSGMSWEGSGAALSDVIACIPQGCELIDGSRPMDFSQPAYVAIGDVYYYTWACAVNNAATLCPYPWSLPAISVVNNPYASGLLGASTEWPRTGYIGCSGTHCLPATYDLGAQGYFWLSVLDNTQSAYAVYNDSTIGPEIGPTNGRALPVRCAVSY
jgi:hypothetical protein